MKLSMFISSGENYRSTFKRLKVSLLMGRDECEVNDEEKVEKSELN
jgi:hypothetical protein